jgi:hypothetical protein
VRSDEADERDHPMTALRAVIRPRDWLASRRAGAAVLAELLRPRDWLASRRARAAVLAELDDPEQRRLIERLRADVMEISTNGDATSGWDANRRTLLAHIRQDDPRCLLRWQVVRNTMFVSYAAYVATELNALRNDEAWSARWSPALIEDPTGCPSPSRLMAESSGNLIHHAYHVLVAEQRLGPLASFDEIVEFGGGYGSFARLLRRLGVSSPYQIHDLPEFSALQRYYLASVAAHRADPSMVRDVTWASTRAEIPEASGRRLFVALWSISEVPLAARTQWCEVIDEASSVLIAFQSKFEGINNVEWFNDLQAELDLQWDTWEIPHLPGNHYLLGSR